MATSITASFINANNTLGRRPRGRGDVRLFGATIDWLASLPAGVRPIRLPIEFTRIANEIHRLWDEPVALERYFAEKGADRRGGRVGFPPLVGEELSALRVYSVRRRLGMQ